MHSWKCQDKDHTVGVLLDRDEAKVHYVRTLSPRWMNVQLFESAAAKSLHAATVADGSGGSHQIPNTERHYKLGYEYPGNSNKTVIHLPPYPAVSIHM